MGPQAQPEVEYIVQTSAVDPFYLRMQSGENGPLGLPFCTGSVIVHPDNGLASFMASDVGLPTNVEVTNPTPASLSLFRVWRPGMGFKEYCLGTPAEGCSGISSIAAGVNTLMATSTPIPPAPAPNALEQAKSMLF